MKYEIYHHGILGQKWGRRRFRNKDGTLTAAGKERYAKNEIKKNRINDSKNRSMLSDEELSKKIERLKMEKEFRKLTEEEVSPGRAETKRILEQVGTKVATNVLGGATLYAIKALFTKSFDAGEFGSALFNGGPKKK